MFYIRCLGVDINYIIPYHLEELVVKKQQLYQ